MNYRSQRASWFSFLLLIFLGTMSVPAHAQCNAAPIALDDQAFHEGLLIVVDVLANDVDPDGEALTVTSVATTCDGTVSESFGLVMLKPTTQVPEDCTITYDVEDESGATASATVTVSAATGLIFEDGFETGDTGGWPGGMG